MAKALRVRPPLGQGSLPSRRRPLRGGGGGHQNFITRAAARKVYSIRGRRSLPRWQGYQRKAVIVIAAVVASGEARPPTPLFDTKTVKGSHLRYCDREVILKGTGTGWSSTEIFVEWVEQVLVPRFNPLSSPYNKIVLFFDGSRTHLGVRGLTVCKKAGVSVVLFPSHPTDIIQPLDHALFCGVKCRYRQLQDHFIKSNLGRSLGVARFVSFVEQAWYQTCTGEKVRTAFRVTSLVPHSVETFLRHAPEERLRPKQEEADAKSLELLAQLASRIVPASDICPASQESSASQDCSMSATDLVVFGWGHLRPLGGDQRSGAARLLRLPQITNIFAGRGLRRFCQGRFSPAGGTPRRGWRLCRAGRNLGARGHRPGVVISSCWWGGERVSVPPSRMCWPLTHHSLTHQTPPVSQEVKLGAFRGPGAVRPKGRGRACA